MQALAYIALTTFGCAGDDAGRDPDEALGRAEPVASIMDDAGSGPPYSVQIEANGTGCPPGTWLTKQTGDAFVTIFSHFDVEVSNGARLGVKDCRLGVRLKSPVPLTYAVGSLSFTGYAFLEPGVRGSQSATTYSAGAPAPAPDREPRIDLTGPVDRAYAFEHTTRDEDLVWTPCGSDRYLNVVTRVQVRKLQSQGVGYMTLSALGAPGTLAWTLKVRACADGPADAGVPALDATHEPIRSFDAGPL